MRISKLLGGEEPTVSFEFFPTKTEEGRQALLRVIDRLSPIGPDFVSVTYGAGGSTRTLSVDACQAIKSHTKGEVMAHLTGLCHTEDEIAAISDHLWESGIENIMTLRGDRPKDLTQGAHLGDFPHAKDLMTYLKKRHDFCLGGACYPEGHKETPDLTSGVEHIKEKIDTGCEFLVTQMFFENDGYFRFVDLLRHAGVEVPVIPGIMPITAFGQLDKFENQFGVRLPSRLKDSVREHEGDEEAIGKIGIEWSAEQCQELLNGGAPGIHFYTLNKSSATVKVCLAMGISGHSNQLSST